MADTFLYYPKHTNMLSSACKEVEDKVFLAAFWVKRLPVRLAVNGAVGRILQYLAMPQSAPK